MDCRAIEDKLAAFLDDELDRAAREQVMDHLASCATCKAEVQSRQSFMKRLDKLPLEAPSAGAKDKIMAKISNESQSMGFLANLAAIFQPIPRPALAGVGLVLVLAIGLSMFSGGGNSGHVAGAPIEVKLLIHKGQFTINGQAVAKVPSDGLSLRDRDLIQTDNGFKGQLIWPDGTKVKVDPKSHLVVHSERLELKVGKIWLQVAKKPGRTFSVETPLAVAAVKGTSFDVIHRLDVGSLVKVYEGLVGVTDKDGDGKSVDLERNGYAIVSSEAPIKSGDFSDEGSIVNDLKPFFRSDN